MYFVLSDDLTELLNLLRNLREEVNGLQHWRSLVDDEKVPALKALLNELEKQMADLLSTMDDLQAEDNRKQKAIEVICRLYSFVCVFVFSRYIELFAGCVIVVFNLCDLCTVNYQETFCDIIQSLSCGCTICFVLKVLKDFITS